MVRYKLTCSKIPSGKASVTQAFGESTTAPTWLSTGAAESKRSARHQTSAPLRRISVHHSQACSRAKQTWSMRLSSRLILNSLTISYLVQQISSNQFSSVKMTKLYLHEICDSIKCSLFVCYGPAMRLSKQQQSSKKPIRNIRIHIVLLSVSVYEFTFVTYEFKLQTLSAIRLRLR